MISTCRRGSVVIALVFAVGLWGCKKSGSSSTKGKTKAGKPSAAKARAAKAAAKAPAKPGAGPSRQLGAEAPAAGKKSAGAPAVSKVKVLANAPRTFNVIFGVNVAAARKSFLWKSIRTDPTFTKITAGGPYRTIVSTIKLDPFGVVDSMVLGFASPRWNFSAPEHVAVLMKGRFDSERVIQALQKLPPAKLGQAKAIRVGGKNALSVTHPGFQSFVLIAVAKNVFAFCSVEIAPVVAKGDPGLWDPALARRLKSVDPKTMLWGVFGKLELPPHAATRLPAALGVLSKVTGGALHVDPRAGKWHAQLSLSSATPQAASSLATIVSLGKAVAASAAGGKGGLPPLVASLVKKVQVRTSGRELIASLVLSKADAQAATALILGQMR